MFLVFFIILLEVILNCVYSCKFIVFMRTVFEHYTSSMCHTQWTVCRMSKHTNNIFHLLFDEMSEKETTMCDYNRFSTVLKHCLCERNTGYWMGVLRACTILYNVCECKIYIFFSYYYCECLWIIVSKRLVTCILCFYICFHHEFNKCFEFIIWIKEIKKDLEWEIKLHSNICIYSYNIS